MEYDDIFRVENVTNGSTILLNSSSEKHTLSVSLSVLRSILFSNPTITYNGVYNNTDYALSLANLNGDEFQSITGDGNGNYGLYFEVEARNDSTVANTGLWYDIVPFLILAVIIVLSFFFFRKNRIKEEPKEKVDDEIL